LRDPETYAICLDDPFCPAKIFGEAQVNQSKNLTLAKDLTIILHDPHEVIHLRSTSAVCFMWAFEYEGNTFRFRKRNILMPGPSSLILECIPSKRFKDDASTTIAMISLKSNKKTDLTLIDFNLDRLDLKDPTGLNICLFLSIFFFFDFWEAEGYRFLLPLESTRLGEFRNPALEIQDITRSETLAAELREDQASSRHRFSNLIRRSKTRQRMRSGLECS